MIRHLSCTLVLAVVALPALAHPGSTTEADGKKNIETAVEMEAPDEIPGLTMLDFHEGGAICVALSPDGTRRYSGGWNNLIFADTIEAGADGRTLEGHTDSVVSLSVSPDGTRLLSSSWDATVRVWDTATGQPVTILKGGRPFNDHIPDVAIGPDGRTAVLASYDHSVIVWDLANDALIGRCTGHTSMVMSVAWSPDGSAAISGSYDNTVRCWEMPDRTQRWSVREPTDLLEVAMNPEGTIALAGNADGGLVFLWMEDGDVMRRWQGHSDWIGALAFSADGTQCASAGANDSAPFRRWDLATEAELPSLGGYENMLLEDLVYAPDGTALYGADRDGGLWMWELGEAD